MRRNDFVSNAIDEVKEKQHRWHLGGRTSERKKYGARKVLYSQRSSHRLMGTVVRELPISTLSYSNSAKGVIFMLKEIISTVIIVLETL